MIEEKTKTEMKMFMYYLFTEPWRKIKRGCRKIDKSINPNVMMYLYFFSALVLFVKNRRNPLWIFGVTIATIVLLSSIWKKKKFIHVYRKEHYEIKEKKSIYKHKELEE